jgi:hypothetical protein
MRSVLALAVVLGACSYDYSNVPLVDAQAGGVDAGSSFTCDPILDTCTAMQRCAMISDTTGAISARCVVPGSGTASAPCAGPNECAYGYYCASTALGSTSCQSYCTDLAPTCADGRACDRATVLFAIGGHTGHPCR